MSAVTMPAGRPGKQHCRSSFRSRTATSTCRSISTPLLSLPEKFRVADRAVHLLAIAGRCGRAARLRGGDALGVARRGLAKLRTRFGGLDPAKPLVVVLAAPAAANQWCGRRCRREWRGPRARRCRRTVSQVVEGVMRMFWIKKTWR